MRNCPVCDRKTPLNPPIIGIQFDWMEAPALILWNCLCNTTRATEWEDATEPMKAAARQVELMREARGNVCIA